MNNSASFQVYNASAGSGKTFTLVKEYLKILLSSDNAYKFQQILAVTFTNKAADEMKERVIENLHKFSKSEPSGMLPLICKETKLPEEIIFRRADHILSAILQNYSAFSITTIDSFTHKLIRTFAYDLQLPMNFDVEMDTEGLLNEAVDIVISKIGENKELTDVLINYSIQKIDDDKSWDISFELKKFAKILLNENHSSHLKNLKGVDISNFTRLKEKLQQENKKIEAEIAVIGNKGLNLIKDNGLIISDFAYSGELPKHYIKLTKLKRLKVGDLKFEGRLNTTIEEDKNLFSGKCDTAVKQIIESIAPELKALYFESKDKYNSTYSNYVLNGLIAESLIPLAVLNHINDALQELKYENNILLNAEFNNLISETIKNEPAPFIYERIGENFRYYFIDEMQDTSELQWKNLIPLIDSALSSENEIGERGNLLLVGDAKQSIYRWRGGKATQFIDLSAERNSLECNPFFIEKEIRQLGTNYRSFSQIIDFNNRFFTHISQFLANEQYSHLYLQGNNQSFNKYKGGYVQLSFLEMNQDDEERDLLFPKKVLEIIEGIDPSFERSDICVLTRTRKQGIAVANYLSENNVEIISSETLLLKNSEKVDFIIHLLNLIQNPTDNESKAKIGYFLYEHLKIKQPKHPLLDQLVHLEGLLFYNELKKYGVSFSYHEFIQMPFYESIEYIVRSFLLGGESDSNIQFFLDVIFEFQQKGQASINGFLEFWELKKDTLSIVAPEADNAVRIMTIHKAKGLEFPVVIFPYDLDIYRQIDPKVWYAYESSEPIKSALLKYSSKLNYIGAVGEELYLRQREELELDNFNLLYVALTRAEEQLYIISEKKLTRKGAENVKYTSGLLIHYLKSLGLWDQDNDTYIFGDEKKAYIADNEEDTTFIQEQFISSSWKDHQISIVANSSVLWDTEQGKSLKYGNLIHEILSKVKDTNDLMEVMSTYVFKGAISKEEQSEISKVLIKLVEHPKLSRYFEHNNEIYNEREIVTANKEIAIPDRLIFNNGKVTIIDYKTGNRDNSHQIQINFYAKTLEKLNFIIDKKLLVYIGDEIDVEEV